jgi:hypothetical protein
MKRNLLEFVKKNWLTIALAVVPPLLIWFFFQRESFGLTAKILADVPVVSVRQEYGREIEVRYRGSVVEGLRVIEIEIANTGTRPLERSAFDSPLSIGFGPAKVTDPLLIKSSPSSLKPVLRVGNGAVTVAPLLLNPGDTFAFRSFVVGGETDPPPITVSGRVRGVSQIGLNRSSDSQLWPSGLSIFAAIFGFALSSISIAKLGLKVSRLTVHLPLGLVVDLTRRLEMDPATAVKSAQLAKELDIPSHDAKANLLFLRLRIEALLRELARRADLPRQFQLGSIRRLSDQLVHQNIIAHEIASAIGDIYPALSRELHEAETYLSETEFSSLERLGLNIIASLTVALEKYQRHDAT